MNDTDESKLMNITQAAAYLRIKVSRLYTATRRNEIPHMKVGRLVRFEKRHLDQWIKDKHTENHNESI